jgi:phosphomevalonate kinase
MRKGQFFLAGTTIVAEGKFAHLVEKATRKSYVIAEGKDVNGIKVQQVTSDFVILTQHDDSETVVLSRNPP